MINAVRREPLVLDIRFDSDVNDLSGFTLCFRQKGRTILQKTREDAVLSEDGLRAGITLRGAETALFEPCDPVYAQVRAVLADGEELHSETAEIVVADVLDS